MTWLPPNPATRHPHEHLPLRCLTQLGDYKHTFRCSECLEVYEIAPGTFYDEWAKVGVDPVAYRREIIDAIDGVLR